MIGGHYGSTANIVQIGALYNCRGFRARLKCGNFSGLFSAVANLVASKSTVEITVDKAQLQKLSELAKIEIGDDMIEPLTNSVNDILALVDQLASANTDGVEPLANPCDANQRLRLDQVAENNRREDYQAIAPQCEAGLYLVPKVID